MSYSNKYLLAYSIRDNIVCNSCKFRRTGGITHVKKCPRCKRRIFFKNQTGLDNSIKTNAVCGRCAQAIRNPSNCKLTSDGLNIELQAMLVNIKDFKERAHLVFDYYAGKLLEEKTLGTLTRNCPKCGVELSYNDENLCRRANEMGSVCNRCRKKRNYNKNKTNKTV
jgi:hypothetical protein